MSSRWLTSRARGLWFCVLPFAPSCCKTSLTVFSVGEGCIDSNNNHPNLGTMVVRSPTKQLARGSYNGKVAPKLDGKNFVVASKSPFVPNVVHAFAACTS